MFFSVNGWCLSTQQSMEVGHSKSERALPYRDSLPSRPGSARPLWVGCPRERSKHTHSTQMGMGSDILERQWVGRGMGGGFAVIVSWVLHLAAPAPGLVKTQKQFYFYSCIMLSFEGLKAPLAWVLSTWSNELNVDLRPWTESSKIFQWL